MNNYVINELETFLQHARKGEITSVVIAASMKDGRSLAAWEVHDVDVLDSLDFVRKCAEDGVGESYVLESDYEKDTAQGHHKTQSETIQENVQPEL
jgi:hypothetical protein